MTRIRPALLALILALLPEVAAAGKVDGTRVEQHLMRFSSAATTLGATPADGPVQVVVGLPWRNRAALERFLHAVADPTSPRYQRFLTPREFARRFAPRRTRVEAGAAFLRAAGLEVTDVSSSGALITAVGRADRVEQALSTKLLDVADRGRRYTVTARRPTLPKTLAGRVVGLVGANAATDLRPPLDDPLLGPQVTAPFAPADIARFYGFDALYAGGIAGEDTRASTIAIATAYAFNADDLQRFWAEFGIARTPDSVELIAVDGRLTPAESRSVADARETTLDVEWASAMAPGARVLVYAGTDAYSSTFLKVYDRIVSDNRAAVLTTSWGRCEADYTQAYLDQVDAVFRRAAAQGLTVIAAAGDRGAFECAGPTPSVGFPASHPYVLAVGGTTLREGPDGITEVAWDGSGGGVSARWPAPAWQMRPEAQRVLADVALNADPTSGYLTRYAGRWTMFGGTSAGAPIWAALVALANQARAGAGRAPLGLAGPPLCEAALAADLDPAPFADVVDGTNGGFACETGWDFPTGWGTPRAAALVRALSERTPPADARGGVSELLVLERTAADVPGAVRLRFQRRCLTATVTLHTRRLPAGRYTLSLDGEAVVSFDTDAYGDEMLTVSGLDVRGHRITVDDAAGTSLFGGTLGGTPVAERQLDGELKNAGMVPGAAGTLSYRAAAGRERLTVQAQGLPAGTYEVRFGARTVGRLSVASTGESATAEFDSMGLSGALLPASPLCQTVIVARDGSAYLRSASNVLSFGECA